MNDYLVKAITNDGHLRAYAVNGTNIVRAAQKRHDTWSAASAALGRSLMATVMISMASLQGDEKLTTRVMGDGPVGAIIIDGNAQGDVRGYVQHPHVNLPLNVVGKIDVRRAVGTHGMLSVTKDLGLREPFTGQVPLISGELGEDFTYYMVKSEQIPSAIGLSVFVNADNTIGVAGGFMIQAMPGANDAQLQKIEYNIKKMPLVSELLQNGETPENILERILGKNHFKILEKDPVQFKCTCSKAHFGRVMVSLGKSALQEMIDEDGGAEAVCKFCGNKYHYSVSDLKTLITQTKS